MVMILRWGLVAFVFLYVIAGKQTVFAQSQVLDFFEQMQDVPVMPVLEELQDQGYVFDKPEGRIGAVFAYGADISEDRIFQYYRDSLPQLGWLLLSDRRFQRDSEILSLFIEHAPGGGQILKVMIAPR